MFLELGIFISQFIWLWRVRHIRRAAKKAGQSYDEYVAENPSKTLARSEPSETMTDVEAFNTKKQEQVGAALPEKCKLKPATLNLKIDMPEHGIPKNKTNELQQSLKKVAVPAVQA